MVTSHSEALRMCYASSWASVQAGAGGAEHVLLVEGGVYIKRVARNPGSVQCLCSPAQLRRMYRCLQHAPEGLTYKAASRMCAESVCARAALRVAALALVCAALVAADRERRAEMSPAPFVMGSRYGRSPPRLLAPRNDRFFMGSRYGKRSEGATMAGAALHCRYTGLAELYRCRPRQDRSGAGGE